MHDQDFEQQLRGAVDGLPRPSDELTHAARRRTLSALGERPNRRPSIRRPQRSLAVVVALLLAFGAVAGFALGRTSAPDRGTRTVRAPLSATGGPGFVPTSGWSTAQTGDVSPPQAGSAAAATVDLLDPPGAEPHRTLATLRSDDVLIQASIYSPADFARGPGYENLRANFPLRTLPLRVEQGVFQSGWEGEPDRWRYVISGRIDGWLAEVDVYVGAAHPSASVRRLANQELARLILPSTCPVAGVVAAAELRGAAVIVRRMLPRHLDRSVTPHVDFRDPNVTVRRATAADPVPPRCRQVARERIVVVDARYPHVSARSSFKRRTYLVSRQGGRYVVWARMR